MQGEKRTSRPHLPARHGNARLRRLPRKRMAGRNAPVLQAAARNAGVAEQGLAERAAAQPGYGRQGPAQRPERNHAMRENHGPAIAVQHHFAHIGQMANSYFQGLVFVQVWPGQANANRANGKEPATLLEPARQRTLISQPAAKSARQKERMLKPARFAGFLLEKQMRPAVKSKAALCQPLVREYPAGTAGSAYFDLSASSFFTPA